MSDSKGLGITYQIRSKLNFLDERLWKRFSARRLELIDTMDLSSKKASEQEDDIRNVAEALRTEFKYSSEYYNDFDRLVRAAIQSVRRNRKRSYRTKKSLRIESQSPGQSISVSPELPSKRQKLNISVSPTNDLVSSTSTMSLGINKVSGATGGGSGVSSSVESNLGLRQRGQFEESDVSDYLKNKFISEISRLNSDSQEEGYDRNYSRSKNITAFDKSRLAIDSMTKPRLGHHLAELPMLPPIGSSFSGITSQPRPVTHNPEGGLRVGVGVGVGVGAGAGSGVGARSGTSDGTLSSTANITLLNFIERSKACSESRTNLNTENLELLGKGIVNCCVSFLFEKSFNKLNPTSIEYLRNKLQLDGSLARIFRDLDPLAVSNINDETAVISLYTLLGGCVKDFGFDDIMFPLCEVFFSYIVKDYPLISKNASPFKRDIAKVLQPEPSISADANITDSNALMDDGLYQLNSLATIATDIQSHEQQIKKETYDPSKKKVTLKFLTSILEFTYPSANSAVPRLVELIENGKLAFKLPLHNDSLMFSLKNVKDGQSIDSDLDLEKIFKAGESIDLEMYVCRAKDIPINELTSTVIQSEGPPKILFPPTFGASRLSLQGRIGLPLLGPHPNTAPSGSGFRFLSNLEDTPPPPPILPKFQPLL